MGAAMSVLDMNPATLPAAISALYERMAARRRAKGEGFGGPYLALLNHPALAERVEALGFYLKFEGVLPRVHYQFIVLSVARATGADFEWQDHVQHALAAGLSRDIIEGIAGGATAALPHPFGLLRDVLSKTLAFQPIPEALQAQAAAEWGKDGLVEIVVVSGFYQMFAAINQGFDISSLTAAANAAEHKP
jgi:4-carboxymuconolactone decarboxylase